MNDRNDITPPLVSSYLYGDDLIQPQRDDDVPIEHGFASQVSVYTDAKGTHVNVIVNNMVEAEWWQRNVTFNTKFSYDVVVTNER